MYLIRLCFFFLFVCVSHGQNCGTFDQQVKKALDVFVGYLQIDGSGHSSPLGCSIFARRAVQAQFHDLMTGGIDGSIRFERNMPFNSGLDEYLDFIEFMHRQLGSDSPGYGPLINLGGWVGIASCGFEFEQTFNGMTIRNAFANAADCSNSVVNDMVKAPVDGNRLKNVIEHLASLGRDGNTNKGKQVKKMVGSTLLAHSVARVTCAPQALGLEHGDFYTNSKRFNDEPFANVCRSPGDGRTTVRGVSFPAPPEDHPDSVLCEIPGHNINSFINSNNKKANRSAKFWYRYFVLALQTHSVKRGGNCNSLRLEHPLDAIRAARNRGSPRNILNSLNSRFPVKSHNWDVCSNSQKAGYCANGKYREMPTSNGNGLRNIFGISDLTPVKKGGNNNRPPSNPPSRPPSNPPSRPPSNPPSRPPSNPPSRPPSNPPSGGGSCSGVTYRSTKFNKYYFALTVPRANTVKAKCGNGMINTCTKESNMWKCRGNCPLPRTAIVDGKQCNLPTRGFASANEGGEIVEENSFGAESTSLDNASAMPSYAIGLVVLGCLIVLTLIVVIAIVIKYR